MTSLWLDGSVPLPSDDLPADPVDDLVVGAGLSGLVTGLLLARAGRRVAVVEARHVGAVATGNTTAKLSLLQGTKLSQLLRHQPKKVGRGLRRGQRRGTAVAAALLRRPRRRRAAPTGRHLRRRRVGGRLGRRRVRRRHVARPSGHPGGLPRRSVPPARRRRARGPGAVRPDGSADRARGAAPRARRDPAPGPTGAVGLGDRLAERHARRRHHRGRAQHRARHRRADPRPSALLLPARGEALLRAGVHRGRGARRDVPLGRLQRSLDPRRADGRWPAAAGRRERTLGGTHEVGARARRGAARLDGHATSREPARRTRGRPRTTARTTAYPLSGGCPAVAAGSTSRPASTSGG